LRVAGGERREKLGKMKFYSREDTLGCHIPKIVEMVCLDKERRERPGRNLKNKKLQNDYHITYPNSYASLCGDHRCLKCFQPCDVGDAYHSGSAIH